MATADVQTDLIKQAANALAEARDADVYLYNADIARPYDEELIQCCRILARRKNVTLILVTEGGDADAGYRIARCLQDKYETFTCIVAGYCKSAGTLVTIGAHELVMTDEAELGPLDVQMSKRDEIGEWHSGLLVTSALHALHEKSFSAFEHFFLTIKQRSQNRITFRMATDIAARLTSGLFAPMFEHIDPMHVGESYRATAIALHYGARLGLEGRNIQDEALNELISGYPTHGFVIDRNEAGGLFNNVREPDELEQNLILALGNVARMPLPQNSKRRKFLSDEKNQPAKTTAQIQVRVKADQDDDTTKAEGSTVQRQPNGEAAPPSGGNTEPHLERQTPTGSTQSRGAA